jgi:hypothetical protein
MPAIYDLDGLRFQYPENWVLADGDSDQLPRSITLHAPGGAFWSVDVHPHSIRPGDLLHEVVRGMQQEYSDLEQIPAPESIVGASADGLDLYFTCFDFIIAAKLRCLRHGHATYLFTYQAEDRDFDRLEPVFQAITISLLRDG